MKEKSTDSVARFILVVYNFWEMDVTSWR